MQNQKIYEFKCKDQERKRNSRKIKTKKGKKVAARTKETKGCMHNFFGAGKEIRKARNKKNKTCPVSLKENKTELEVTAIFVKFYMWSP